MTRTQYTVQCRLGLATIVSHKKGLCNKLRLKKNDNYEFDRILPEQMDIIKPNAFKRSNETEIQGKNVLWIAINCAILLYSIHYYQETMNKLNNIICINYKEKNSLYKSKKAKNIVIGITTTA